MKIPIDLPFCLFLILVIFLSLAPPREANGRRAGDAMVVRVVILKWLVERMGYLWFVFGLRNVRGDC